MGANTVAVLMVETELPIMMTCADAAIPKGTILNLHADFTVTAADTNEDVYAGIAAEEKIAGDGKLQIAVYRRGLFKCEAGAGNVARGTQVGIVALNNFTTFTAGDSEKSCNFGQALDAATDTQFFILDLGGGSGF